MGAYLSRPETAKVSESGEGNRISYGASSMQGWRVSQEDAHNCIANFDEKCSLFAVYDGHGGADVAQYLSKALPSKLKEIESYQKQDYATALTELFLTVDRSIITPQVLSELQALAKKNDGIEESGTDYADENVSALYEEATMPLNELVEKYKSGGVDIETPSESDGGEKPCSSKSLCGTPSSSGNEAVAGGSGNSTSSSATEVVAGGSATCKGSVEETCSSTSENDKETTASTSSTVSDGNDCKSPSSNHVSSTSSVEEDKCKTNGLKNENDCSSSTSLTSSDTPSVTVTNGSDNNKSEPEVSNDPGSTKIKTEEKLTNGTGETKPENNDSKELSSVESSETVVAKKKGKSFVSPALMQQVKKEVARRISPRKVMMEYKNFFAGSFDSSESEDEDDDDVDIGGEGNDSDDSDDENEAQQNSSSSDDDDDDFDDDDEEDDAFLNELQEPGFDSGATAVVGFMKWESDDKMRVWVANVGDSRCVASKDGVAIELSDDHKPENDEEARRIVAAGGAVTNDGRVNGGLNLSRALGDHSYKQNANIPLEEQMISPLPTIQEITLDANSDDFLVFACDGIWNSLSSQQVVDFITTRLEKNKPLPLICEELFDTCLAPHTGGDGTGCDNMTAIIVKMPKGNSLKRSLESENADSHSVEDPAAKKLKVDDTDVDVKMKEEVSEISSSTDDKIEQVTGSA